MLARPTRDFQGWQLYERHPEAVAAECHKLLLLQMACEKLCKAHVIQAGRSPEDLQASHAYVAKHLPTVIREQLSHVGQKPKKMRDLLTKVRQLANEIEVLNPAVRRDGQRPDNCEYPWELGGQVISPLSWNFNTSHLLRSEHAGRTFIKLLRGAIDRIINELEK